MKNNIHPISDLLLKREDKETWYLDQKGNVFWLYGLSGSGKSTLAVQVERDLQQSNIHSIVLDGDNLRIHLNKDLGFSDNDQRRKPSKSLAKWPSCLSVMGLVVIASFITPRKKVSGPSAREIIGNEFFHEVYVKASLQKCRKREMLKALYAKAAKGWGGINLQGEKLQNFEEPIAIRG